MSHVPIQRKYSELFKLGKDKYTRDVKGDKKFLEFYRDFRNTLHANFIYYGNKDTQYIFNGITFNFCKGKVVSYNDPIPLTPYLYLDLVFELINISSEILISIDYPIIIPYPDQDAQK